MCIALSRATPSLSCIALSHAQLSHVPSPLMLCPLSCVASSAHSRAKPHAWHQLMRARTASSQKGIGGRSISSHRPVLVHACGLADSRAIRHFGTVSNVMAVSSMCVASLQLMRARTASTQTDIGGQSISLQPPKLLEGRSERVPHACPCVLSC